MQAPPGDTAPSTAAADVLARGTLRWEFLERECLRPILDNDVEALREQMRLTDQLLNASPLHLPKPPSKRGAILLDADGNPIRRGPGRPPKTPKLFPSQVVSSGNQEAASLIQSNSENRRGAKARARDLDAGKVTKAEICTDGLLRRSQRTRGAEEKDVIAGTVASNWRKDQKRKKRDRHGVGRGEEMKSLPSSSSEAGDDDNEGEEDSPLKHLEEEYQGVETGRQRLKASLRHQHLKLLRYIRLQKSVDEAVFQSEEGRERQGQSFANTDPDVDIHNLYNLLYRRS